MKNSKKELVSVSNAARRLKMKDPLWVGQHGGHDDLGKNCLRGLWRQPGWRGARDSRRIESEAGEYNTSFKNLRCLGKRRTWAVAGGGVTSRKFFF